MLLFTIGPDVGGDYGPYRQSERKDLYKTYIDKLVQQDKVYPCFCTDEELAAMKAEAQEKSLPPIYRRVPCLPRPAPSLCQMQPPFQLSTAVHCCMSQGL